MKEEAAVKLYQCMTNIECSYIEEAQELPANMKKRVFSRRKVLFFIAAALTLLGAATAVAASMGYHPLGMILAGYGKMGADADPTFVQEQLENGQWVSLSGSHIAVIVPESPVKILLSSDGGKSWSESVVEGSQKMEFLGAQREQMQYAGGYIGFFEKSGGYLILTSGVAMNHQALRIFLTDDSGKTWHEIGNPYEQHISVLTGAAFSTPEIGFISYRYFEDSGPDIWWTHDGGESWEKLPVTLPPKYRSHCSFTPGSPVFDGKKGTCPITVFSGSVTETIYMYSDDAGLTWHFNDT